jgi:hypothetical protein
MSSRKLLALGLFFYVFSLQAFAQSATPSPSASDGERTTVASTPTDHSQEKDHTKEIIFGLSATGGVVALYAYLRMRDGTGAYHVNQFRVYFIIEETSFKPARLSENLEKNFTEAFTDDNIATAYKPQEGSPDLIGFRITGVRRWLAKAPIKAAKLFGRDVRGEREDNVEISRPNGSDAVIQARTLQYAAALTARVEDLPERMARENLIEKVIDFHPLDQHFLAGIRSWCIAEATHCDQYGEPVPPGCHTLFLETAAFERYSYWIYWMGVERGAIRQTWQRFLYDALELLGTKAEAVDCKESGNRGQHVLGGKPSQVQSGLKLAGQAITLGLYKPADGIWKKVRVPRRQFGGRKIQVWQRERAYEEERLEDFGAEEYVRARLFSLHLGIAKEYRDALRSLNPPPI